MKLIKIIKINTILLYVIQNINRINNAIIQITIIITNKYKTLKIHKNITKMKKKIRMALKKLTTILLNKIINNCLQIIKIIILISKIKTKTYSH